MSLEGNLDEEKKLADREAFVKDKEDLLRNYPGKFVAYVGGKRVCVAETCDEVVEEIQKRNCGGVGVYIEKVDEEAFKEPPPVTMAGSYRVDIPQTEKMNEVKIIDLIELAEFLLEAKKNSFPHNWKKIGNSTSGYHFQRGDFVYDVSSHIGVLKRFGEERVNFQGMRVFQSWDIGRFPGICSINNEFMDKAEQLNEELRAGLTFERLFGSYEHLSKQGLHFRKRFTGDIGDYKCSYFISDRGKNLVVINSLGGVVD